MKPNREDFYALNWPEDRELLSRAARAAKPRKGRHPRWVVIRDLFLVGSTTACDLCHRFNLDPNEEIAP